MSASNQLTTGCLCGAVSVVVNSTVRSVGACHCSMCRKWGGGPLLAIDCGTDVVLTPIDGVTVYDSSEWAERGFCANCGTHLFYRLKQSQQYIMPVGLFNIEGLVFDHQVFIDEKPEYYRFANETKNMTGAEVFAAFS
ncbi:GFA family protein [Amphritea sp. HPY]|uniref:GFA family protein n=1 Tax=Amphritea sp. HPY TaxID=3421652 RepID=UPI003D7DEF73